MKRKFLIPFLLACVSLSACSLEEHPSSGDINENFTVDLQQTMSLAVGQTQSLVVGITYSGQQTGNPEITWTVSDSEIVSISSSKTDTVQVTGLTSGTATVTALVGKTQSASCRVTVNSGGSSETVVTGISLSESDKEFVYDISQPNTFTLIASVTTNNGGIVNPTWKSTVESVATVSGNGKNGVVTVHGAGEANIVATAGAFSAQCVLHVRDGSIPETISVSLNMTSATVEVGKNIQLTATVSGNAAVSTIWQSDGPAAEVTGTGLVIGVSKGNATISVTVTDAQGNTDMKSCYVVVKEPGEQSQYDQQIALWSKPGSIYFHYLRDEHDYDNWAIWAWQHSPKDLEGTLWGANKDITNLAGVTPTTYGFLTNADCLRTDLPANEPYRDEHGIVIRVEIDRDNLPGGKTGKNSPLVTRKTYETKLQTVGFFIVDQTKMTGSTNWKSDGTGEIYIEDVHALLPKLEENYLHVYCVQGKVSQYSTSSGAHEDIPNPTIADKSGMYRSIDDLDLLTKDEYQSGIPTSETFLKDRPGTGYQIFVPSFADSDGDGMGDLRGIINKLDYLQNDVGAKVLWLTPIQKSNSYHGYDVTDYYRIDQKFGTLEDYRELIYSAHQRGMKVLMDMVINHTSKSNVLFQKSANAVVETVNGKEINYRDMYIWKFKGDKVRVWNGNITMNGEQKADDQSANFVNATLGGTEEIDKKLDELWYKDGESDYYYFGKFGSGMAELNYNCEATRTYMTDMCKYWLSFGLDGFRLDATKHIYLLGELSTDLNLKSSDIVFDVGFKHYWNEEQQKYVDADNDYSYHKGLNVLFWKQFAGSLKAAYPNCYLVGENFDGWDARMAPFYQSMDSQFDFQTYFNLNQFYESSIGGKIKSTLEVYKQYRQSGLINGSFTSNHDIYRMLNHAAEHDADIPRGVNGNNHAEVNSSNKTYAINMAKYYAATTLLAPGVSWIYYGDELGMSGNLKDLVPDSTGTVYNDHGNNVDRWYRQPMRWGKTKGEDMVPNYTFGGIEILWDFYNQTLPTATEQKADKYSILNLFKEANRIKNLPEYPTYGKVDAYGSITGKEKGECYIEYSEGSRKVCYLFNNTDSPASYMKLGWKVLGGFGADDFGSGGNFTVPAHGFLVLSAA